VTIHLVGFGNKGKKKRAAIRPQLTEDEETTYN